MIDTFPNGEDFFTSRLYTAEKWSATLAIENFQSLPFYNSRTLVFSSLASASDTQSERTIEWAVECFPKGVWFKKFYLIVWQGTLEMPEHILPNIRISISCKEVSFDLPMKVGILTTAVQDGIEYLTLLTETKFIFTEEERVLNLDHLVPFDKLNNAAKSSPYLVGENKDEFRVQIIIVPAEDPALSCCN